MVVFPLAGSETKGPYDALLASFSGLMMTVLRRIAQLVSQT